MVVPALAFTATPAPLTFLAMLAAAGMTLDAIVEVRPVHLAAVLPDHVRRRVLVASVAGVLLVVGLVEMAGGALRRAAPAMVEREDLVVEGRSLPGGRRVT